MPEQLAVNRLVFALVRATYGGYSRTYMLCLFEFSHQGHWWLQFQQYYTFWSFVYVSLSAVPASGRQVFADSPIFGK